MLNYVVPRIAPRDVIPTFVIALTGGFVGGVYGIIHDQVTFVISPEYFRNLKFVQFHYLDFGLGERVFAGAIGFLAAFSFGFAAAWFLARRFLPRQPRRRALGQIALGFGYVFGGAITASLLGYLYGVWKGPDGDYALWSDALARYHVEDRFAFVRVAYIHNASYLGGVLGVLAALLGKRSQLSMEDS